MFWRVEGAELGAVIRARREARRQSIEALAGEAGMHPTYLGVIERGHGNPTWDKLSDVAEALEIPVSTLAREAEAHRIRQIVRSAGSTVKHGRTMHGQGVRHRRRLMLRHPADSS